MTDTINRETDATLKGFRFQKLRAAIAFLDKLSQRQNADLENEIYVSLENEADIKLSDDDLLNVFEEDKCYDPQSNFTFASNAVLNTLVYFLDIYLKNSNSEHCYFVFCSTRLAGKESRSDRTEKLGITPPKESILKTLSEGGRELQQEELIFCKEILIDEYRAQYESKSSDGYLESIKSFTETCWVQFFKQIKWLLGHAKMEDLEILLASKISESHFFRMEHLGKEEILKSAFLDLLDKTQSQSDRVFKKIYKSRLQLLFYEVAAGTYTREDPTSKLWDTIPNNDCRNLKDKILSVSSDFNKRKLGLYIRKAAQGIVEIDDYIDQKELKTIQYHILDACENELTDFGGSFDVQMSTQEIDQKMNRLIEVTQQRLEARSKDFNFKVPNQDSLRALLFNLFDSCYLAFD